MINLENIENISALLGKTIINKKNKVGAIISYQSENEETYYIIKSTNEELILNGKEKEILRQLLSWERIKE